MCYIPPELTKKLVKKHLDIFYQELLMTLPLIFWIKYTLIVSKVISLILNYIS